MKMRKMNQRGKERGGWSAVPGATVPSFCFWACNANQKKKKNANRPAYPFPGEHK